MSVALYMDVHVPLPISEELVRRAIDVLTAQDDGAARFDDDQLLERATSLGRVLFTQDADFLRIGAERQTQGRDFAGILFLRQDATEIGRCVDDLELIGLCYDPPDLANRVEFLPL